MFGGNSDGNSNNNNNPLTVMEQRVAKVLHMNAAKKDAASGTPHDDDDDEENPHNSTPYYDHNSSVNSLEIHNQHTIPSGNHQLASKITDYMAFPEESSPILRKQSTVNSNNNNKDWEESNSDILNQGYGVFVPTAAGDNGSLGSSSTLMDIPIPLKLRPFVKRLEDQEELTEEDILAILFIVRLGDAMIQVQYATFLTQSFVHELRKKLAVEELDLEIEIAANRWTYQHGAVVCYNRMSSDMDAFAMRVLSRIALNVLEDRQSVSEGLREIQSCEDHQFQGLQKMYRTFPGKLVLLPISAATGCIVYFGGTLIDGAVCLVTGFMASFISYRCSFYPQMMGVADILIAISTAILSITAVVFLRGSVCFPAQVLAIILNFVPGFAFVLSFYEITQNLVLTGIARFCLATLKSYVLAFGLVIGLWIASFDGPHRYAEITSQCQNLDFAVDKAYFSLIYPIVAVSSMMELKVAPKQWPVVLLTQLVAIESQFLISIVWNQPTFVSTFIPSFLATIAAHVLIVTLNKHNLTKFAIEPTAYLLKKLKPKPTIKERLGTSSRVLNFVDNGWTVDISGNTNGGFVQGNQHEITGGYRRLARRQYQRSDLWYCLAPALGMLVPGAKIWRVAFFSIVESSIADAEDMNGDGNPQSSFQALIGGLFVIGMGQVMGVRLGLVVLWAASTIWRKLHMGMGSFMDSSTVNS